MKFNVNMNEIITASLKISGVLSNSLSREDWKILLKSNSLQEIDLLLEDRIKSMSLETLIKKDYERTDNLRIPMG